MRRVSSLVVLVALAALTLPAIGLAADTSSNEEDVIVVISGDVSVPRGETVDDIYIASGDLRLAGRVTGDVVLFAGDATVSGRIDGDLVTFAGQARLLPRAPSAQSSGAIWLRRTGATRPSSCLSSAPSSSGSG
jgi:hypothetical protein